MSSVLSAQPAASFVDMDHTPDHGNTPSKSFTRDPSSSSTPSISNYQGSSKASPPRSPPPRTPKLEQPSPASESSVNAHVNGHMPESTEEKHQVPSQNSPQEKKEQNDQGKEDSEWPEQIVQLGSDADDDPDFESGEGDGDWAQDEIEADMRRVKVYELVDQKWTDRGTAFCQGDYNEKLREAKLIARAEHTNEILLECTIRCSDVYQRQQDTLIVWTEPDGTDYALSFQDIEGCAEVWEFILEVQRHLKEKGVFCLRAAVADLAELIIAPFPLPLAAEEESTASEGSSSMHMSTGTLNPFSIAVKLPGPALGNMPECERAIRQNSRLPHGKEKLCDVLMQMDYVKRIIDVMKQAEDLEDVKELHACCSCMQTILMLNDHNLLEYVLQEHIFTDMVGVLEYDPEFPTHKAFYREFLENCTQFRQPIPIREPAMRQKIEQTYRLQFLKDVVLARATDDATFNVLNSCIIFNQIDIVNQVQHDEHFLREIVGLFLAAEQEGEAKGKGREVATDESSKNQDDKIDPKGKQKVGEDIAMDVDEEAMVNGTHVDVQMTVSPEIGPVPAPTSDSKPSSVAGPSAREYSIDDRRKDTMLLIQQLCVMGKNVQLPARLQLFRTLVERGILHAVQWAVCRPERQMVSTAGEVLGVLLDHDVNGVRQHVMKQLGVPSKPDIGVGVGVAGQGGDASTGAEGNQETLLETLCRLLTTTTELAYKSQMADALRAVLEVPQSESTDTTNNNIVALRAMARAKDDPVTERFLEYFYTKCCEALFRPMSELPDHRKFTEPALQLTRERSNLLLSLCDLLSSFALQHSYRSHFFIVSSSSTKPLLVPRIASLLRAREKHLCLAALRFFRACLKLGNRNLMLHLVHCDVLVRILELTAREAKWDNLLSSCCQEFFEHIRKENIKELLTHLMTKYESKIQELSLSPICGQRFQSLIRRWEMNNEPPPKDSDESQASTLTRKVDQPRTLEAEEESYFNNSDDEEAPKPVEWQPATSAPSLGSGALKRKRGKKFSPLSVGMQSKKPWKTNAVVPRLPLVDYDEDDESGPGGSTEATLSKPSESEHQQTESPSRPVDWFSQSHTVVNPSHQAAANSPDDHPLGDNPTTSSRAMRMGSPPRIGEKRRRLDEDDEDELLERLVRTKRQQTGGPLIDKDKEDSKSSAPSKSATPGKLKLKLGATSLSLASSSPPEKPAKDADSG